MSLGVEKLNFIGGIHYKTCKFEDENKDFFA
jgi:hypothetical protein